ncbi:hypothetical protein AVEN_122435-1 [Araneus ventricosus]|uniref:Transposase Tc1-like domain-containing protein n=1 Tax=Araneus ventricosus TaxID=182803 RepID=A0A4Y2FKP7_ARAVE|nr:hypothetical protein AVEN_122435-1 [Araneus ventricosus]
MIYRVLTRKTPYEPKPRSARPRATDIRSDRRIHRMASSQKMSVHEITRTCRLQISKNTAHRRIIESGYMIHAKTDRRSPLSNLHVKVSKAGHSPLFQNGIFGTREGKTYRQGRRPVKFGANHSKRWNEKKLKSKTQSADSNLRPRWEGSGRAKDLPTLAPRVETRNETRNPSLGGRGVKDEMNSATLNLVSKQTLEHL